MKAMKIPLVISLLLVSHALSAQVYKVGHTTLTCYDSSRNRNIETEIYYPADTQGENIPVAQGNFPVVVFGHGFIMDWESYENFWTELTPQGYVMCFPVTEMGLSPSHETFGLDLRFVASQMQAENLNSNSLFYQKLSDKAALMGHSMGGGAAFLASANNTTITTMVSFAAAETSPSAIGAATQISVPALVFAGEEDCITPPEDNQLPLYNALASDCKNYVSINKGVHCYFADYNFSCAFGESLCNPTPDISRDEQQSVTFDFLNLWLDYTLRSNEQAWIVFNDSLQQSARMSYLQNCNTIGLTEGSHDKGLELFPNPATDHVQITLPGNNRKAVVFVYHSTGELVFQMAADLPVVQLDIDHLTPGHYLIRITNDTENYTAKFVKIAE